MVCRSLALALVALLATILVPQDAASQSQAAQLDAIHSAARESQVFCYTHFSGGIGVLVRDRRTVLFPLEMPIDAGRPYHCRLNREGAPEVAAQVAIYREASPHVAVLTLHQELDGTPLQLASAERRPFVGDRLWSIRFVGMDLNEFEVVETLVNTVSTADLSVAVSENRLTPGTPVLDETGAVSALVVSSSGRAIPVSLLLDETRLTPRGFPVMPLFGIFLSYLWNSDDRDRVFLDFDLGAVLWDQLVLAFRIGVDFPDEQRRVLPPSGMRGWGVVEMTDPVLFLGIEPRYRLLLHQTHGMPMYLEFLVGVQWEMRFSNPQGLAFYSMDARCNPAAQACPLMVAPPPPQEVDHGVGPTVGISYRVGGMALTYHYTPGALSYDMPDHSHRISLGFTMF
ncbi:MAG: hypothetical protein JW797_18880 [Bradymonadales bacterium]|nr:hypothetical protein [Bradymonadales bacterium]